MRTPLIDEVVGCDKGQEIREKLAELTPDEVSASLNGKDRHERGLARLQQFLHDDESIAFDSLPGSIAAERLGLIVSANTYGNWL